MIVRIRDILISDLEPEIYRTKTVVAAGYRCAVLPYPTVFKPEVFSLKHLTILKGSAGSQSFHSILLNEIIVEGSTQYSYLYLFHNCYQYQSCFSFRFKALILSMSSADNSKSNMEMFSFIWSGLLDPGITTTPRWRSQRRMT